MASYAEPFMPVPGLSLHKETFILKQKMAALQIIPDKKGRFQSGLFTHLVPESRIELCGAGFNNQTVQIRVESSYYIVLRKSVFALQSRSW